MVRLKPDATNGGFTRTRAPRWWRPASAGPGRLLTEDGGDHGVIVIVTVATLDAATPSLAKYVKLSSPV